MTFQVLITIICDDLAIINCLDYILCIFFRTGADVRGQEKQNTDR